MTKQTHEPGPGRSAPYAAFTALKTDIAQRYEHAEEEARKLRAAREQEDVQRRRREGLR